MAKKVVTSTKHGGLETPRNSFELPVETSYGLYAGRAGKLCSSYTIKESSKNCYSVEAPMKKLISEEISNRSNTRRNEPSIVARLMGVDMLPAELEEPPIMIRKENETPACKLLDKERLQKGSVGHDLYIPNSSPHWDLDSFDDNLDDYSDRYTSKMKLRKPKPRVHPQEEELQKFKKEFEAWQAARFNECSKVVDSDGPNQLTVEDGHIKETNSPIAYSTRMKNGENLMEPKDLPVYRDEMLTLHNHGKKNVYLLDGVKESLYSNRRSRKDLHPFKLINPAQNLDIIAAPTKIVILRPGPDRMGAGEDSWNDSPSTFKERGSILSFLEEVKERLNSELQGKSSKITTTVRGGIETPCQEKPSEPRQIAQRIAQQVRDSVARDLRMNLLHSESTKSTRSSRSDNQLNGAGSPEFVNRDTRRLLTERLTNVLKGEPHQQVPTVSHRRLRSSVLDYEKSKVGQLRDVWNDNDMAWCENFISDIESHSTSFRQDIDDYGIRRKEPSPGDLVRSLSAPVPGTSFGKLLLEDPHILTGAQIRMKHEVVENVSMSIKRQKKDKFNIREKVSSFGYSLTLRGRLFRRRVQSVDELHYDGDSLFNDIASGPTVIMSSYETRENSTEVPPSPASVCSDEFWKPAAFPSPTSSSVNLLEDSEVSDGFSQINSNLNDLRREVNQLECTGLVEPNFEEQSHGHVLEADIDDPAEAYVRDLLVASGHYNGSCNQSCSKSDPLSKTISNQVFEQVEESYRQSTKDQESCDKNEGSRTNHRMLLDLLNEALPTTLGQPEIMSRSGKAIWSVHKPLQGKELLSCIWEIIKAYMHPADYKSYYALDKMLAQDLETDLGSRSMDDEIHALCRELERLIVGDLIEETIKYMHL